MKEIEKDKKDKADENMRLMLSVKAAMEQAYQS